MAFPLAACAEMLWTDRPMAWRASRLAEMGFGVGLWNWPDHDLDALEKTGAARAMVDAVSVWVIPLGPIGAVSAIYFMTMVLTSLITNTAAAALMVPIALSMAETVGVDNSRGFIFAVAFGASACFATPLGYQTNLMVYGPGGYRFTDFLRLGLPMHVVTAVMALGLAQYFWIE